jgi:hypothetical protein
VCTWLCLESNHRFIALRIMILLYTALTNVQMLPLIGESLCAGQQTYGLTTNKAMHALEGKGERGGK